MNEISYIQEHKIIVIVRGVAREDLLPFAEAVYRGGGRLMECTYDATGATPDEQTASNIAMLAKHFEGRMLIGAGTVLTEKQVELTKAAGGRFIISPDTNPDIIAKTKKEGLVSIPGALTPSEATLAHRNGADFIKLFPINYFGAKYLKDLKAPLAHLRFLAVGGVTLDNLTDYLAAGACGFGIGSAIVNKQWIAQKNYDAIEQMTRQYVQKIEKAE